MVHTKQIYNILKKEKQKNFSFLKIQYLLFYFCLLSALMECLVLPLHDKLEEWKKMVVNLDKEHSKGT